MLVSWLGELGPVIRADVNRHTGWDEEVGQGIDYIGGLELAIDTDRQTSTSGLDDIEH